MKMFLNSRIAPAQPPRVPRKRAGLCAFLLVVASLFLACPTDGGGGGSSPTPKTATPDTDTATAAKATTTAASVTFTLTNTYTGTPEFKVYGAASGGDPLTDVTASYVTASRVLTLTSSESGGIGAATYHVSAKESGKSESGRLALTVTEPGIVQTDTPAAAAGGDSIVKILETSADITVTLTTTYTGTITWKVYDAATGGTASADISGNFDTTNRKLTLTYSGADAGTDGFPEGDIYISATEGGKTESARLKITVSNPMADKTALVAQISEAEGKIALVKPSPANDGSDVDAGFKWVSQTDYDALANVLAAAKALQEDGEADQDDVNAAAEALDTAIDTFEAINKPNGTKPADKAALSAAITDAQAKLAAVVPSGNATADGNGSDVHTSQKWVPRSVYITFQNAINAAIAVKDVTTVQPQATVDTALATLAAATATFDAVTPQNGTSTTNKAELNAKIEEAETLLETTVVSTDGSNVLKTNYWVSSQTPKTTLDDAITAAETVADNAAATQAQVDAAKNTLTTAIANFTDTNVRKPGLAIALNVTVSFTGLADETMTLTGGNSVNWDAALTVSLTESFTSYQWYLNGTAVSGATANSITLAAKSHRIGSNRLAVEVTTASGAIYSKTLNFTVSQVNAPAADGE